MTMHRAYSVLDCKQFDDEERVIRGLATSPVPDRANDIVVQYGAKYAKSIPLFLYHDSRLTVGTVKLGKPTKDGIPFEATLPKIAEPGALQDRVNEAWQLVKYKLIAAVSIGFQAIEGKIEYLKNGGHKFLESEILELSLVPIPMQSLATIQSIKSFDAEARKVLGITTKSLDQQQRAALGHNLLPVVRAVPAGASALKKSTKPPKPEEGNDMKPIAEQIAEFEATRVSKAAEMEAIMTKAAEEGATLDAEQSEQFDTLESEVASIDKHLDRLRNMQKAQAKAAKPVADDVRGIKSIEVQPGIAVRAKNTQKLEPGIAFARAAKCLALGHLEHRDAIQIAKALYDGQDAVIAATERLVTKAAVAAATASNTTWAGNLVGDETNVFADFVEYLRPQTILGRFGQSGVPSLRRVPFRTPLIGQTSGGDGYWVGEGQAKPLTKFDFSRTTLEPLKVANIAVATMEVVRDSSPAADVIIRDQLAAALRERLDIDFIDPAKTAVSGVSPASILNGVSGIPATGTGDADDIRADVRALFGAFIAANNAPTSGVFLMPATTALALSLMTNPLGQSEFPGITMAGGTLLGLPVIVSEYIPTDTSGAIVALVNASDIYLGDEGGIDLSMSTEASLQMDSAPDNPTSATTVLVSLWQRNLVGFRAERTINWARRRSSAVAYLTGVNWGVGA